MELNEDVCQLGKDRLMDVHLDFEAGDPCSIPVLHL